MCDGDEGSPGLNVRNPPQKSGYGIKGVSDTTYALC